MKQKKIILVLFSAVTPIFLLLLSYKLTLAFFPVTATQQNVISFLEGSAELLLNHTSAEISHLQDVTRVMNLVDLFFYGSGVMVLGFMLYFQRRYEQLQALVKYGGITTISVVLIFLLSLLLQFDLLFTWFHQLFFPQGNWNFPVDSLLIQTFPLTFFIKVSITLTVLTLLFGSLFIVLSFYLAHATHPPRN